MKAIGLAILALLCSSAARAVGGAAAGAVMPGDLTIQIRPHNEIESAVAVTVADIARLSGFGESDAAQLLSIRLADAPRSGEARAFTGAGLSQVLRDQIRGIEARTGAHIKLLVPSRVTVTRKAFKIDNPSIETELRRQMQELCHECEFEITQLSVPAIAGDLSSALSWRVKLRPELPKGAFAVPLEIQNDDSTRRLYWIAGQVAIRRQVPIAKRTIAFGEAVTMDDVIIEKRDVTFSSDVAAETADFAAAIAARGIPARQIVWKGYLQRQSAVRSGEMIRVVTGNNEWQVSVEGVCQQTAQLGQLVRVKIPRTQKILSGLVVEKGVVEVR